MNSLVITVDQSFNEIFMAYEEKTRKKLEVTYIPVSELDARIAANPEDLVSYLQRLWATEGPFRELTITCIPTGIRQPYLITFLSY